MMTHDDGTGDETEQKESLLSSAYPAFSCQVSRSLQDIIIKHGEACS